MTKETKLFYFLSSIFTLAIVCCRSGSLCIGRNESSAGEIAKQMASQLPLWSLSEYVESGLRVRTRTRYVVPVTKTTCCITIEAKTNKKHETFFANAYHKSIWCDWMPLDVSPWANWWLFHWTSLQWASDVRGLSVQLMPRLANRLETEDIVTESIGNWRKFLDKTSKSNGFFFLCTHAAFNTAISLHLWHDFTAVCRREMRIPSIEG